MSSFLESLLAIPDVELDEYDNLKKPPFHINSALKILENNNICRIAKERNVKYLYHFTDVRNLPNIFLKGLLVRNECGRVDYDFFVNDYDRLDKTNGICCSISFPNYRMFYKIRKQKYQHRRYCVIVLDALQIFINYFCLFFKTNASSRKVNFTNYAEWTEQSFNDLFSDEDVRKYRCLKSYEPTDVQAEVIVMDNISKDYILGVSFENNYDLENTKNKSYNCDKRIFYVDKGLFLPRHDYKFDSINSKIISNDEICDEIENLYNEQNRRNKYGS